MIAPDILPVLIVLTAGHLACPILTALFIDKRFELKTKSSRQRILIATGSIFTTALTLLTFQRLFPQIIQIWLVLYFCVITILTIGEFVKNKPPTPNLNSKLKTSQNGGSIKNAFWKTFRVYKYLTVIFTLAIWTYMAVDDYVLWKRYWEENWLQYLRIWTMYYFVILAGLSFYFWAIATTVILVYYKLIKKTTANTSYEK